MPAQLAGGTYGVALRGLFAGESMFHRQRDASKVALVHLVHHLATRGYRLFDIQQLTAAHRQPGSQSKSRATNISTGWPKPSRSTSPSATELAPLPDRTSK